MVRVKGWKLLPAALLFASCSTAAQVTPMLHPFLDVPPSNPSYEAILYLQANHLVQGNPDGTFRPDTAINRAEFTKILVESIADPHVIATCLSEKPSLFKDVNPEDWFAPYVCTAKKFGMLFGNPDGTFRPANSLIFAEAATLLARNEGLLTTTPKAEALWFKPYVEALAAKKAIPVTISGFDLPITRAEMAEMMYRIKASIPPKESLTYDQVESKGRIKAVSHSSSESLSSGSGMSLGSTSSASAFSSLTESSAPSDAFASSSNHSS